MIGNKIDLNRIRPKSAMGFYGKLRWSNDSSLTAEQLKTLKETIGNKFSKRGLLTRSELRNETPPISSSSSDENIFELDLDDSDDELVTVYQNRERKVSNSQQDENVCLLNQGHDIHNINSALSNLEDYNFRKVGPPHNKNNSPENIMDIDDIEGDYPLATIGSSRKKQSPVNNITSARSCASPPIIIDQTELTQQQFSVDDFDIKLRDEVDNLRLTPGSKMIINTTIGEIREHAYRVEPVVYEYMNGNATIYDVVNFILNTLGIKKEFISKIECIESKNKFKTNFTIESRPFRIQVLRDLKNF